MIAKAEYMDMYHVIGAAMTVHQILGRGLEEPVYQEALGIEFERCGIKAIPQFPIHCFYGDVKMKKFYLADYYLDGLVIELKSVENLCSEHRAQLFNYMRLTHTTRGLLINFGERSLHSERYIYNEESDDFILLTEHNYKKYITENN